MGNLSCLHAHSLHRLGYASLSSSMPFSMPFFIPSFIHCLIPLPNPSSMAHSPSVPCSPGRLSSRVRRHSVRPGARIQHWLLWPAVRNPSLLRESLVGIEPCRYNKKLFKISCNPEKAEFSGSGFRILFAHRVLFRGFFAFFTSDSLAILL